MAKSRIAGITIEIGGDTTKLQTALKGVDSELKETQSSLKDVNKLLKMDPGNVELLNQKQKLLTDAINQTNEKLQVEKTAMEQLKSADPSPENAKQQDALAREIAETEQSLKSLSDEYKTFGSTSKQQAKIASQNMKNVGKSIQDVGEKMAKIGAGMTVGVTGPIVGAAAASKSAWEEVDAAMDTITTKTGATGQALEDMQNIAKSIATTIPADFQSVADAVGEVNTRFGVTGDELEELSTKFVQFAELNGTDVSTSIDLVQSSLAAWNLGSEDAGAMLDLLNKQAQDTGISVDSLAQLMDTNAPALQEMGYSASDAAVLLAGLDKAGVDTNAAMTGLKRAYSEAADEGVPLNAMLSDLSARLLDADTNAEATAEAIDIFGTRAGPALVQALEDGRLSFDELGTSMSDFAGNVGTTYEETLDPMDQMTQVMNEMKLIGADIVETAGPALVEIFGMIGDAVTKLAEYWNSLDENQKETALKIVAVVAAAGPLITVFGGITSGIGTLVSAGSGLAGMFTGLIGKIGGVASGAGSAVQSMSSLGSAATAASAPVSSAGGAMGTLSSNALGLVAAGAGILLAAAGIALLAQSAIQLANAGPLAIAVMAGLVVALAGLAAGAALIAAPLTAGAVGLIAFGAAITLVGVGILAATAGMALLATQLPTIATYGGAAAINIAKIGASMAIMAAGTGAATLAFASFILPMAGAAVTIAATDLALVGMAATAVAATVGMAALGVATLAVSEPVETIREDAEAAGDALSYMVTSVDLVKSVMDGLGDLIGGAIDAMVGGSDDGLTEANKEWMMKLTALNASTRSQMGVVENTIQASLLRIRTMFKNTKLEFNQKIAVPHFSMSGSFDAQTGSVPSVNVSWYRKAMDNAYLLNGATIFGAMNGRYLGGGEAGSEMVVGTDKMMQMIREASGGGITMNQTINSPKALNASEIARQTKLANRQALLALRRR